MASTLRMILARSPLGPPVRRLYALFHKPTAEELKTREDDRMTREIITRVLRSDSNAIDVGCHEGTILRAILASAPQGRHIAVEPLPDFYTNLKQRFPQVTTLNCALSDSRGTAEFTYVKNMPAYSGLRERSYPAKAKLQKITVQLETLDSIVPQDTRIDLIKVDVEGAELQVFRGAPRTITQWHPHIIFEHGEGAAQHYGVNSDMIYDCLTENGLQISGLTQWLTQAASYSREEFAQAQKNSWNFIAHPPR